MNTALEISNLKIGYPQKKGEPTLVAGPMNLSINHGELICLLGPNGVGKTTLLRTMAGIQDSLGGGISIMKQKLAEVDKKKLAKLLSVVLTERIGSGNLSAYELISLGRIPYTGWFGKLEQEDSEKISWAIENTNVRHLVHKSIHELSDGERQKVMIARALAQDTPVILLDEPTAHLDIPNRIDIIRLLKKLAKETGKAIILSTHELDLALQAADRIWLMTWENITYSGTPEDLVLNDVFGKTFTKEGIEFQKGTGIFKVVEPHCSEIHLFGDEVGVFWTRRALERLGYSVIISEGKEEYINVRKKDHSWLWDYQSLSGINTLQSIEELVNLFKPKELHT